MTIASFANKVFQVDTNKIYTFNNFQYTSALRLEKQEAAGKKPSTYNKGVDLDSISFSLSLKADFGINPRSEWETWMSILQKGIAYPFILGGVPISNTKWLLTEINPSNFIFDNKGRILSLDLSLQLQEYVRSGSVAASKSTAGKVTKQVKIPPGILTDGIVYGTGMEDKSSYKRDNPNMTAWNASNR